jgi:hypothetical protein
MSAERRDAELGTADRHQAAVARSLGWALESAERGDYADALEWLHVIEAIGDRLPPSYQTKRGEWHRALGASPARSNRA